jgi:hypothetical protein
MSKERTVLLRTTSFSVEAGEAAVGARPATVASDDQRQRGDALNYAVPAISHLRHMR